MGAPQRQCLLVLALVAGFLGGCGGGTPSIAPAPVATAPEDAVTGFLTAVNAHDRTAAEAYLTDTHRAFLANAPDSIKSRLSASPSGCAATCRWNGDAPEREFAALFWQSGPNAARRPAASEGVC